MSLHENLSAGERSGEPRHGLSLEHLDLPTDQVEELERLVRKITNETRDPAALAAIADFLAQEAVERAKLVVPAEVTTGEEHPSEPSVEGATTFDSAGQLPDDDGKQEKGERLAYSPEQLAKATTAYSLDLWASRWGGQGAEPKASKGIRGKVLNDDDGNEVRRMAYGGFGFDYMGLADQFTQLVRAQLTEPDSVKWFPDKSTFVEERGQLRPGEAVVVEVLEEREPTKEEYKTGRYEAQDTTFILAFRNKDADKADGDRDNVSLVVTLPRDAAKEVQQKPALLIEMIPYLTPNMPDQYKKMAEGLTIKGWSVMGPSKFEESVISRAKAKREYGLTSPASRDDTLRKNIAQRISRVSNVE